MPLYATTAHNTMLDAMWAAVPSFEVGLLSSDPRITGTVDELAATGGYARVAGTSSDWQPAVGKSKSMNVKTFPVPTDAWSATATRWAIFVDGELWDHGALAEEIAVTAAGGTAPAIRPRVGFNEGLI